MARVYSNTAVPTTASGSIGAAATTVNVVDTGGWPTPGAGDTALAALSYGDFTNVELVTYTGKTTTTLTGVTRGVDGTSARAHNAGAQVWHILSAKDLENAARKDVANTFTAKQTIGSGDAQQVYFATNAQDLAIKRGTSASPDSNVHPLVKAERTLSIAETAITGDGVEQLSSLVGISVGTAACEVQPVGVGGFAKSSSTVSAPGNDACGLYGVGRITGSGTGVGIGAFVIGRRDTDTGYATGLEVAAGNYTPTAAIYDPAAFGRVQGIWMTQVGDSGGGTGILIGKPSGRQAFDVGIGFTAQNPVTTATFRDDGNAATSLLVKGTHATAALAVAAGAGPIIIGRETLLVSNALLEVYFSGNRDPVANFTGNATTDSIAVRFANGAGSSKYFASGGAGAFMTGTAGGDTGIAVNTAAKKFHLGGTASVLAVTRENTLSFFNVTPVAQQTGIVDADGTLADITTKFNSLLSKLEAYGLLAVA
jgi:hypothetical protein